LFLERDAQYCLMPRPTLVLVSVGASLIPWVVLLGLVMGAALSPGPAFVAAMVIGAGSYGLGGLLLGDFERLSQAVRSRLAPPGLPPPKPILPALREITADVQRVVRSLEERTMQTQRMLAVDETIVELLPDPLIVLATDRSIGRANAAARAAFGSDIPSVLRHPALRAAVERAMAQETLQTVDLALPVPVGRELHVTVIRLAPLPADGPLLLVLSDRTRERAVERMREDFVANASHELRTPLASLIGFIDTLRGPAADDPPAQQRFLGIMAEQAARMNRLIDDLLSLSRIELTEHLPPAERLDVAALVRRMAAGFEPRLAERHITLTVAIAPDLPELIADGDQLAQVLQNLLDNAVKYGRVGGTIHVSVDASSGAGRFPNRRGVLIAVRDDGAGIAREHIGRLTERFYRVDKGRSRAAGGTGLGLAIVKHVINRHRGQLLIESEEGKGSTFTVWLPLP
jgi:two-component system phosphate regulon sensor histidine kinase PhoR